MFIGPYAQPRANFAEWKRRGCNALFWAANDTSKPIWEAAAEAAGMPYFTEPNPLNLAAEAKQLHRIGWNQPDEPDAPSHVNLAGSRIKDLAATYAACHAANPNMPVILNCEGSAFDNIYYDGTPHPGKADGSLAGHRAATGGYMAWGDVISFDYHLWTTGRPGQFAITQRLMDRAWEWSGHKPIFVYVETCTQGTGLPFTADDYESQVNNVVDYAKLKGYVLGGIIYFATQTKGSMTWPASFDITPPDVVERMIQVHARLLAAPAPLPPPITLESVNAKVDKVLAAFAALKAALG